MVNVRYSKYENKNHLFDEFASFCGYNDSVYLLIDMLNHMAEDTARYEWDVHLLLAMHGSNLARWSARMTDPLNKGDELYVYVLCDMLKWHAFIYTKTKPWTSVDSSIADLTVAELCMICDVCLIFLGDSNYGVLKYKQCIQSLITSPAASGTDEKPDKIAEATKATEGEPSSGTVVGFLNEHLSTGTVVSLPQSLISIELEAVKSLLALKSEGDTTNQLNNQQSLSSSLPVTSPAHPTTNNPNPNPPPPEANNIKTAKPNKESNNLPAVTESKWNNLTHNVETQVVEMTVVETSPESDLIDTMTPGGVIILPLPSHPVTPLNVHPENKKVETGGELPTSQSDTSTDKNDHVETTNIPISSSLKVNVVLNKCAVTLTKLSNEDVKWLCGQKTTSRGTSMTELTTCVETHYRTRSSMKPKPDHQNWLPHSISLNVSYEQDGSPSSEDDKSPVAKKCTKLCPKKEASSTQINVTGLNFEITFVNNTSSSTTCFKYCISLDFRPSIMEFPTRHLALCNRVYLSGCSQFKQVGTRSNQLDLVPVHMI